MMKSTPHPLTRPPGAAGAAIPSKIDAAGLKWTALASNKTSISKKAHSFSKKHMLLADKHILFRGSTSFFSGERPFQKIALFLERGTFFLDKRPFPAQNQATATGFAFKNRVLSIAAAPRPALSKSTRLNNHHRLLSAESINL